METRVSNWQTFSTQKTFLSLAGLILLKRLNKEFLRLNMDSLMSKLLMKKKNSFLAGCLIFHGGREMGRGLSAKNTSRAAFCRQRRTKQSFNESRVAPKAQPSTGGVIHILLIVGWRSSLLIDTAL